MVGGELGPEQFAGVLGCFPVFQMYVLENTWYLGQGVDLGRGDDLRFDVGPIGGIDLRFCPGYAGDGAEGGWFARQCQVVRRH